MGIGGGGSRRGRYVSRTDCTTPVRSPCLSMLYRNGRDCVSCVEIRIRDHLSWRQRRIKFIAPDARWWITMSRESYEGRRDTGPETRETGSTTCTKETRER